MSSSTSIKYGGDNSLVVWISLGFVGLLAFSRLWAWLLTSYVVEETELDLVSGILTRLPIVVLSFWLLKRFGFQRFTGIDSLRNIRNVQAVVIPAAIISMGFFGSFSVYQKAGPWLLTLFTINTLLVALAEELTFRGLILPLLIRMNRRRKSVLFVSVLMASGIFGVMHYLNLFRQPGNFWGISSQVLFAVSIGVFLGGLMLRTRHLLAPVFIHFLVNFSFGNGELEGQAEEIVVAETDKGGFDLGTVITLFVFGVIFLGGWYMIKRADKAYVLNSLNIKGN